MGVAEAMESERDVATEAPDVRVDHVTKHFDDTVAVDDLSIDVPRGSFFALLGPSGCGKTTTLRMIGGFEEPTEGRIFLGEREMTGLPPYRRDVNTVFQSYALFPHLTVFENVAFGLRRKSLRGSQVEGRVREILKLVDLEGLERRKPALLSGGQQQRVALARAIVNKPQVLLLDEPLGALDLKLRKQMQLELKLIQHELGLTFVHVTHDQEEAMTMADTIAVMNRGRIEQLGPPDELYELPRTAFVAGFLGISNLLSGTVTGPDKVRLDSGSEVTVPASTLDGRTGRISIGIRPEKMQVGSAGENSIHGEVFERAYVGVSTQYVVETAAGRLTVYVQNAGPSAANASAGDGIMLSWSPESTFVVDAAEEVAK